MSEEVNNFRHTVHVTFMYDGDSISFEEVDIGFSDVGLVIVEKNPKAIQNTVIPYAGIKYYTIMERIEKVNNLEVL